MPFSVSSALEPNSIKHDAFNRLRVSQTFSVFETNFVNGGSDIFNKNRKFHNEKIIGNGTITHIDDYISLSVSDIGDKVVFQTKAYIPVQQGKSKTTYICAMLCDGMSHVGSTTRVGTFDDKNDKSVGKIIGCGHFFEYTDNILYIVERNTVNGVQIDTKVPSSEWNIDKLDGHGISGVTLGDVTHALIFVIDSLWMGSGHVRMGFNLNGVTTYCHKFYNGDKNIPYIVSPTVPVRMDMTNTTSTMLCESRLFAYSSSVEGGELNLTGSKSVLSNPKQTVGLLDVPVALFRLKESANRIITFVASIELMDVSAGGKFMWTLYAYASTTPAPTFTSLTDSTIEYDNTTVSTLNFGIPLEYGLGSGTTRIMFSPIKMFNGFVPSDVDGNSVTLALAVKSLNDVSSDIVSIIGIRELN